MIDLDLFTKPQERWLVLSGSLDGIGLLIRYSSPEASEEFQAILDKKGMKDLSKVPLRAYLTEFCRFYIRDWKGPTRGGQPAKYAPEELAKVLCAMKSALEVVTAAIRSEADFFIGNETQPNSN